MNNEFFAIDRLDEMPGMIKAYRRKPGEICEEIEIENTLEALQREVGGYIEIFPLSADCCVICNEEGKLQGLPYTCRIRGEEFVGTILVVGIDGEEFCDAPEIVRVAQLTGGGTHGEM